MWGLSQILCSCSCCAFKIVSFGSIITLKSAVSLFHKTTETSLFGSDSVKTTVVAILVSVLSIEPSFVGYSTVWGWGKSSILCYYSCFTSKVVVSFSSTKTPKLAGSLFCETTENNLFVLYSVELVSVLISALSL